MTRGSPRISVCIPAYNRASVMAALLDSVLSQNFDDYEIVVCEDASPEREAIRRIVSERQKRRPGTIEYHENETNLGYDGNLRRLVARAKGEYCLFMGNDDLMCPGALAKISAALARYPDIGVVMRSYATFHDDPGQIGQEFRYFDRELFFPAGPMTVATFYRRSVVISGMVVHRESAQALATDRYDGTLLYQLHLVARMLLTKNGVFLPDILVLYRTGGVPDFGNSAAEKGKFKPREQTPESSLEFIRGLLRIALDVDRECGVAVYEGIFDDVAAYSYPLLAIQARRPFTEFLSYAVRLARLGFWRSAWFLGYWFLLTVAGPRRADELIKLIKMRLGRTPMLGAIYQGRVHAADGLRVAR